MEARHEIGRTGRGEKASASLAAGLRSGAESLRQEFPYPRAKVYAGLLEVLPAAGFKVQARTL